MHNFGAAAVVSGPIFVCWLGRDNYTIQRRLAWLVVFGAMAQIGSGIGFGFVSYFFKGHLPELEGVALIALLIKLFCVVSSPALMLRYVLAARSGSRRQNNIWLATLALGSTALTAAAFLRWYL